MATEQRKRTVSFDTWSLVLPLNSQYDSKTMGLKYIQLVTHSTRQCQHSHPNHTTGVCRAGLRHVRGVWPDRAAN